MAKTSKPAKPSRKPAGGPRPVRERAAATAPQTLLKFAGAKPGELKTVEAPGPRLLLGAQVVMGGAQAGVSQVGLEIDGEMIVVARPDQVAGRGLAAFNPTGVFATYASFGKTWTVVLGWPYPLAVARQVRLAVQVMEEIPELELSLVLARA